MPTEITFIPYGERWEPKVEIIAPKNRWLGLRKPREECETTQLGATVIQAECVASDDFTGWSYKDSDGVVRHDTLHTGDASIVIHRASPKDDERRGTLRIRHVRPPELDQETREESDPQPSLAGGVEEPISKGLNQDHPADIGAQDLDLAKAAVMGAAVREASQTPTEVIN